MPVSSPRNPSPTAASRVPAPRFLVRLQALSDRLRHAGAAHDWSALAQTDAELAQWLGTLDPVTLSEADRAALQPLRRLHAQVRTECERELDRLRQTLAQMQQQRHGWLAYAESHAWGPESPP
ncbi:flagellar protein FliT [Roseateles amylovorans]|uniref:Flagellar protein FliT n=1 Tax=Roseateles amylovorans TaxID=2978473 RepID=A0ABY6AYE7_9BURK|nr:flagellar protein FliT [Roseateles amylovorans]UXH76896.1 flagellar protein FliT [Roseateles amylovorans]